MRDASIVPSDQALTIAKSLVGVVPDELPARDMGIATASYQTITGSLGPVTLAVATATGSA